MKKNVVIVGGGQATVSLLSKLRTIDFENSITVICEEDFLPYQRPPLSKAYLLDKIILLKHQKAWNIILPSWIIISIYFSFKLVKLIESLIN